MHFIPNLCEILKRISKRTKKHAVQTARTQEFILVALHRIVLSCDNSQLNVYILHSFLDHIPWHIWPYERVCVRVRECMCRCSSASNNKLVCYAHSNVDSWAEQTNYREYLRWEKTLCKVTCCNCCSGRRCCRYRWWLRQWRGRCWRYGIR